MQPFSILRPGFLGSLSLVVLTACGGGGGGDVVQDVDDAMQDDVDSGQGGGGTPDGGMPVANGVTILSLDSSAPALTRQSGTLDLDGSAVTVEGAEWTLNADGTRATLGSDIITFEDAVTGDATRFDASIGTQTTTGIGGVTPDLSALPTGTATYTGDAVVTAIAGTELFELSGAAEVTATFGAGSPSVTTEISALEGTRQPALTAPTAVADAGTLTIAGSAISGTGFSGGDATLTSSVLSLSGGETVSLEGGFFGADAGEAGGVFIIDDGDTRIFGDFLAD